MVEPEPSAELAALFEPHDVTVRTSPISPDAATSLHPDELAAARPMVSARRAEYATGRACARAALAVLGVDAPVRRGADRAPIWPEGITGSISHGDGVCVAVVAPVGDAAAIGVDVERISRLRRPLERRILNDDERASLDGLDCDAGTRQQKVAVAFAAKEAFYKAFHQVEGRFIGFDAISVAARDDGIVRVLRHSEAVGADLIGRTTVRWRASGGLVAAGAVIAGAGQSAPDRPPPGPRYPDQP